MLVLAIDSALGAAAAAVVDADAGEVIASETLGMERGQDAALVPLIGRVVARVPGGFPALGRVAVTVGPGSFTGLRVGLAAARAIGLALGVPVVGVTTFAAYAAPLVGGDERGAVAVALDARRGDVYVQVFAPGGRTLVAPRAGPVKEAARALGSGPARLAGPAAAFLALEAWALGVEARVVDPGGAPPIEWVARLGAAADPSSAPPRPLYMRGPMVSDQSGARVARA